MELLPDVETLPDDLDELGRLFQIAREHCQVIADGQPGAYSLVGGEPVVTYTPQEQQDELNAAREVAQTIAVKMSRLRLEANAAEPA